jgi:myo-inositol-1(or 4)-monophosphatase
MEIDLAQLRHLESIVADAADSELMPRFRHVEARTKPDGSLVTEADLCMQRSIEAELLRYWPDTRLLGEEMSAMQQARLLRDSEAGMWILDPLDGTSNFCSGIPFFGVSLALCDARGLRAGVVFDPLRRESFSALRGGGAWLNGEPLHVPAPPEELAQGMAMVDFKRLPAPLAVRLSRHAPYRSQRSFGSVVLDWCWLAAGRVHLYLHGGQQLWDYAAGSLVFSEAGGSGGLYLDYAGQRPHSLSLEPRIAMAAGSQALFERWRDWLEQSG